MRRDALNGSSGGGSSSGSSGGAGSGGSNSSNNDAALDAEMEKFERVVENLRLPASRAAAETYLLAFESAPGALALTMHAIRRSKNAYAQFQAARILRNSAMGRWHLLNPKARNHIRETVLENVAGRFLRTETFLAKQLLQTVAVLLKREWIDASDSFKNIVFEKIRRLLISSETTDCGNEFLLILVDEFLSTARSSPGLRLEWHRRTRRAFEANGLQRCLRLGFMQMKSVGSATNVDVRRKVRILANFLKLLPKVLAFDFGADDTDNETVCLGVEWRDLLIGNNLVDMIFDSYKSLRAVKGGPRHFANVLHLCREAAICLASFRGGVFSSEADKIGYFGRVVHLAIQVVVVELPTERSQDPALVSAAGEELVDFCRLLRCVVKNAGLGILLRIRDAPKTLCAMREITCQMMLRAASSVGKDDPRITAVASTWYSEAFDSLLDVWSTVALSVVDASPAEMNAGTRFALSSHCAAVFKAFVECRAAIAEFGDDIDEDECMLREQLDVAIAIGRCAGERSATVLNEHLTNLMKRISSCDAADRGGAVRRLRWIVRSTACLIADDATGEEPMVPFPIMRSEAFSKAATALVRSILSVGSIDLATAKGNRAILNANLSDELLKAVQRVTRTYLMPDIDGLYERGTYPNVLRAAYGSGTDGASVALAFAVRYSRVVLSAAGAHRSIALSACALLQSLAGPSGTRSALISCAEWRGLIADRGEKGGSLHRLPRAPRRVVREITRALCRSLSGAPKQVQEAAGAAIAAPLLARLRSLVVACDRGAKDRDVLEEIELLAQSCRGALLATDASIRPFVLALWRASHALFFRALVSLHRTTTTASRSKSLDVRREALRTVVKILRDAAEALLPFAASDPSVANEHLRLCEVAIDCFVAHHRPRVLRSGAVVEEADAKVVSAVVDMCRRVIYEFSSMNHLSSDGDACLVRVFRKTLESALPVVALPDMQLPKFQKNMFRLIRELCETRRGTNFFASLPGVAMSVFGKCIIYGTEHDDESVAGDAYRTIRLLVGHRRHLAQRRTMAQSLDAFLVAFLKHIVRVATKRELPRGIALEAASNALLDLILIASNAYRNIVGNYLKERGSRDPASVSALGTAFTNLTSQVDIGGSAATRATRALFLRSLKRFMFDVEGLLGGAG
eukprot:g1945.t1